MRSKDTKINFTVAELITELQKLPQDLPVITTGYETGFENILKPKVVKVEYKSDNKYWDGEFQETEDKSSSTFKAVVLDRKVRN